MISLTDAVRIALIGALLSATACNQPMAAAPEPEQKAVIAAAPLPVDPGERAATCYAARVVQFSESKGPLTVEQASQAAHFLLLGASSSGITEPTKVDMLQKIAQPALATVRQTGQAPAYLEACSQAYPATAKAFAGLPADSRDTRLQCFALSMGMNQIYDQSPQIAGDRLPRYRALYAALDTRVSTELNPGGRGNLAEIAGLAARSMATALELGPITQVLDACAERYNGPPGS